MNIFAKRCITAVALAALVTGAAHAHRAWIVPSATVVSGDKAWVTLDGAISNNLFYPDHVAMAPEQIKVTAPDGSNVAIANASKGKYRTTFDIELKQKGTYRIANASSGLNATYMEGTERKRWRGTMAEFVAQGIDKKTDVKLSANNRRVETFVTNGAPTEIKATGRGLELLPVTHPNDLYAGEEISFRLVNDGKPAAGVEVVMIQGADRYRDAPGEMKLKTGADGVFKVTPEQAGMYWLEAETQGQTTLEGKTIDSRSSYVAVLEVLPG